MSLITGRGLRQENRKELKAAMIALAEGGLYDLGYSFRAGDSCIGNTGFEKEEADLLAGPICFCLRIHVSKNHHGAASFHRHGPFHF